MTMNVVTIKMGGEWKVIEDGLAYVGESNQKAFVIKDCLALEELKRKVHDRFKMDEKVQNITFGHLHPFRKSDTPFLLETDEDLLEFMEINRLDGVEWTLPLCINIERKVCDENDNVMTENSQGDIRVPLEEVVGNMGSKDEDMMCKVEEDEGDNVTNVIENNADIEYGNEFEHVDDLIARKEVGKEIIMHGQHHPRYHNDEMCVGKLYGSKDEIHGVIRLMSTMNTFGYKVTKSDPTYFRVRCVDKTCEWMMHSTKVKGTGFYEVKKYNKTHTCTLEIRTTRCRPASYHVVADKIKASFEDIEKGPTPAGIKNKMRTEYGLNVSYWKAWKAEEEARNKNHGTPEEGYSVLPAFCYVIKQMNPGTVTKIEKDSAKRFKYFYMAYGASIEAFPLLRKVIVVDATFLTGQYRGSLIAAVAQDANKQIYPLAFAIVDSENDASWSWFFEQLVLQFPSSNELVFVSDRHQSIAKGIAKVYSSSHHYCCTWHLKNNLRVRFKKQNLCDKFTKASESYTLADFNTQFGCISEMNTDMAKYLRDVVPFERWSRAHAVGQRYNMMTSNNAETINSVLRGRKALPIVAMLRFIREKMSTWFNDRKNDAERNKQELSENISNIVHVRCSEVGRYNVKDLNNMQFEVVGEHSASFVDLEKRTCTCKVFDLDHIPCVHAIAAIRRKGLNVVNYVSNYFSNDSLYKAYQRTIYPELTMKSWDVPEEIGKEECHPPIVRKKSGRPQRKRKLSTGEFKKKVFKTG